MLPHLCLRGAPDATCIDRRFAKIELDVANPNRAEPPAPQLEEIDVNAVIGPDSIVAKELLPSVAIPFARHRFVIESTVTGMNMASIRGWPTLGLNCPSLLTEP